MADWGAFFRADDGSLLVTSDTPCYELQGTYSPTSRQGNVNTYYVTASVFPLIVVNCGAGNTAGVLSVEGSPSAWTVQVLSNVSCQILAFVPISGNSSSGYGMAAYDSTGRLVFDSSRNMLNARQISNLAEGVSFQSPVGTNSVSYTSGPVRPSRTQSQQQQLVESWLFVDTVYQCRFEQQYVCTPQFVCNFDPFGGFSCGFVDSCSFQLVQICGFVQVTSFADIYATVRTTNWNIDRGTASIGYDGVVSFAWTQHKSGYYKEVLEYQTFGYSFTTSGGLPIGYIPPPVFVSNATAYEGELNKDSTYPYTSDRANTGALACITAVRSDYE